MSPTQNKKIKNAQPVIADGIKFRSRLEKYCYKKLKENNIQAEYEKYIFDILEPFEYNGEKIRKMSYKPDFVGPNFIIECKGFANEAFPLRWKFFKYYLFKNKIIYDLYIPRNMKDVDKIIKIILKRNDVTRKI